MEFSHIPVLLQPCLDGLAIDPAGIYLDGTAGGAGHSMQIAKRLTTGQLIALDQDPDAVATATERLKGLPARVVQANFRDAARVLAELSIPAVNGALLDLGVSSHQLDEASRGFSYHADAPLDMRMSQQGPTAADLVNSLDREELTRILRDYGEEPYAWQIAGRIVAAQAEQPIATTMQLAQIVASAVPPERRAGRHLRLSGPRRAAVRDHLPQPGRPARQEQIPPLGPALHLPAGTAGMHLRRGAEGKTDHPQTHRGGPCRTGAEPQGPFRQTQSVGESIKRHRL